MKKIDFKDPGTLMLLIGNIVAIVGCFLPFVSLWGFSASYIEGDGIFVLILCLVSIALAFFKANFAFIANIVALVITFIAIANAASFSLEVLGIGAYAIIIANIVAIIGSIKAKKA